jgi:hypothetical protein
VRGAGAVDVAKRFIGATAQSYKGYSTVVPLPDEVMS